MQKRRRVFLVIGLLLFGAVLTTWYIGGEGSGTRVELAFVGVSNELTIPMSQLPVETRELLSNSISISPPDLFGPDGLRAPAALFLVTNAGSTAVEVCAAISPVNFTLPNFAPPTGKGLPRVLKPGESLITSAHPTQSAEPWWTEFSYQRRGLVDRMYVWIWNHGDPAVQTWLGRVWSGPNLADVKCGPITNQFGVRSIAYQPALTNPPSGTFIWQLRPPNESVRPFLKFLVPRPSVNPQWEDLQ